MKLHGSHQHAAFHIKLYGSNEYLCIFKKEVVRKSRYANNDANLLHKKFNNFMGYPELYIKFCMLEHV